MTKGRHTLTFDYYPDDGKNESDAKHNHLVARNKQCLKMRT
jgi:hypothetical protein